MDTRRKDFPQSTACGDDKRLTSGYCMELFMVLVVVRFWLTDSDTDGRARVIALHMISPSRQTPEPPVIPLSRDYRIPE